MNRRAGLWCAFAFVCVVHCAEAWETISQEGLLSPVITLRGPRKIQVSYTSLGSGKFKDQGASCVDPQEGNLDSSIKISYPRIRMDSLITQLQTSPTHTADFAIFYSCTNPEGATSRAVRFLVVSQSAHPAVDCKTEVEKVCGIIDEGENEKCLLCTARHRKLINSGQPSKCTDTMLNNYCSDAFQFARNSRLKKNAVSSTCTGEVERLCGLDRRYKGPSCERCLQKYKTDLLKSHCTQHDVDKFCYQYDGSSGNVLDDDDVTVSRKIAQKFKIQKNLNDTCTHEMEATCGIAAKWGGDGCEDCATRHRARINAGLVKGAKCTVPLVDMYCSFVNYSPNNRPMPVSSTCRGAIKLECGIDLMDKGPACEHCVKNFEQKIQSGDKGQPCTDNEFTHFCYSYGSGDKQVVDALTDDDKSDKLTKKDGRLWGAVDNKNGERSPPTISINGKAKQTVTFSSLGKGRFHDLGAHCFDKHHGNLDSKLKTKYPVIRMESLMGEIQRSKDRTAELSITYSCTNTKGLTAIAVRKVEVTAMTSADKVAAQCKIEIEQVCGIADEGKGDKCLLCVTRHRTRIESGVKSVCNEQILNGFCDNAFGLDKPVISRDCSSQVERICGRVEEFKGPACEQCLEHHREFLLYVYCTEKEVSHFCVAPPGNHAKVLKDDDADLQDTSLVTINPMDTCTHEMEETCGLAEKWNGDKCNDCIVRHRKRIDKGLVKAKKCTTKQMDSYCDWKKRLESYEKAHPSSQPVTENCKQALLIECGRDIMYKGPMCERCVGKRLKQISKSDHGKECTRDEYDRFCYEYGGGGTQLFTALADDDKSSNQLTKKSGMIWGVTKDAKPTLELKGPKTMTFVIDPDNFDFVDPGAKCIGSNGKTLPFDSGIPDLDQPGKHLIAYTCTDKSGKSAEPVYRTIISKLNAAGGLPKTLPENEEESSAPILSCIGNDPDHYVIVTPQQAIYIAATMGSFAGLGSGADKNAVQVTPYKDPGVKCVDPQGLETQWKVVGGNSIYTQISTTPGKHSIEYTCTNSKHVAALPILRDVLSTRQAPIPGPPLLHVDGEDVIHFTLASNKFASQDEFTPPRSVCVDSVDGDISSSVAVTAVDVSKPGPHRLEYTCKNSRGKTAKPVVKTVISERSDGTVKPQLHLNGGERVHWLVSPRGWSDPGASCYDDTEGDPHLHTVYAPAVDVQALSLTRSVQPSTFVLKYTCVAPTGSSLSAQRTVIAEARTGTAVGDIGPAIELNGPTTSYFGITRHMPNGYSQVHLSNVGDLLAWEDPGSRCFDKQGNTIHDNDGDSGLQVMIPDLHRPGTHVVKYTCKDSAGKLAEPVQRTVISFDSPHDWRQTMGRIPVITLKGPSRLRVMSRHVGSYHDPGATCADPEEGDITPQLQIHSPQIDKLHASGTYEVWYTCTDSNGLTGYSKRVVMVESPSASNPGSTIATACVDGLERLCGRTAPNSPKCSACVQRQKGTRCSSTESARFCRLPLLHSGGDGGRIPDSALTRRARTCREYFEDACTESDRKHFLKCQSCFQLSASVLLAAFKCGKDAINMFCKKNAISSKKPVITLLGQNPDYYVMNAHVETFSYDDPGAQCEDPVEGDISYVMDVDITSAIAHRGRHLVSYLCRNSAGVAADKVFRQVVTVHEDDVRAAQAERSRAEGPFLTLRGKNPMELGVPAVSTGLPIFNDPGATCTDTDGHPLHPTLSFSLNSMRPGRHTVTYTCFDSEGNGAIVDRIINIHWTVPEHFQKTAGMEWGGGSVANRQGRVRVQSVKEVQSAQSGGSTYFAGKGVMLLFVCGFVLAAGAAVHKFDPELKLLGDSVGLSNQRHSYSSVPSHSHRREDSQDSFRQSRDSKEISEPRGPGLRRRSSGGLDV